MLLSVGECDAADEGMRPEGNMAVALFIVNINITLFRNYF